jgi:hypothetical protein
MSFRCETNARKLLIIKLSEPRPYGRALFHCRRDRMLGRERLASSRTDCEIFARNELQTLVERAHVSRDGECSYRSSGRSRPVFSPQERFDPQPRIRTTPNAA